MWGIAPTVGIGRVFKELLPVGSRIDGQTERPRAVSEYMIERMLIAGVEKIAICCVCSTQAERSKP